MALVEWTDKAGAGSFSLVIVPAPPQGVKSLKVQNDLAQTAIKILNQSEIDNPTAATVKTQLYLGLASFYSFTLYFRFIDTNNYFAFFGLHQTDTNILFKILKREAGAETYTDFGTWNNPGIFNEWHEWEVRFCEVPAGTVCIDVYVDGIFKYTGCCAEGGLVAGGGVGVGCNSLSGARCGNHYFDYTRIYYV